MDDDGPPPRTIPTAHKIAGDCVLVVGRAPELSQADAAVERILRWLCASVSVLTAAEWSVQPANRRWPRVALAVFAGSCGDTWQPVDPDLPVLLLGARGPPIVPKVRGLSL